MRSTRVNIKDNNKIRVEVSTNGIEIVTVSTYINKFVPDHIKTTVEDMWYDLDGDVKKKMSKLKLNGKVSSHIRVYMSLYYYMKGNDHERRYDYRYEDADTIKNVLSGLYGMYFSKFQSSATALFKKAVEEGDRVRQGLVKKSIHVARTSLMSGEVKQFCVNNNIDNSKVKRGSAMSEAIETKLLMKDERPLVDILHEDILEGKMDAQKYLESFHKIYPKNKNTVYLNTKKLEEAVKQVEADSSFYTEEETKRMKDQSIKQPGKMKAKKGKIYTKEMNYEQWTKSRAHLASIVCSDIPLILFLQVVILAPFWEEIFKRIAPAYTLWIFINAELTLKNIDMGFDNSQMSWTSWCLMYLFVPMFHYCLTTFLTLPQSMFVHAMYNLSVLVLSSCSFSLGMMPTDAIKKSLTAETFHVLYKNILLLDNMLIRKISDCTAVHEYVAVLINYLVVTLPTHVILQLPDTVVKATLWMTSFITIVMKYGFTVGGSTHLIYTGFSIPEFFKRLRDSKFFKGVQAFVISSSAILLATIGSDFIPGIEYLSTIYKAIVGIFDLNDGYENLSKAYRSLVDEVLPALWNNDLDLLPKSDFETKLTTLMKIIKFVNEKDYRKLHECLAIWDPIIADYYMDDYTTMLTCKKFFPQFRSFVLEKSTKIATSHIPLCSDILRAEMAIDSGLSNLKERKQPFCVGIVGPPGIGKTTMVSNVISALVEPLNLTLRRHMEGDEEIWLPPAPDNIPTTFRFLSNITPFSEVLLFDDVGIMSNQAEQVSPMFQTFMDFNGTKTVEIPKAEISEKKNQFINNKLSIVTSNLLSCGAETYIRDMGAFQRRMQVLIHFQDKVFVTNPHVIATMKMYDVIKGAYVDTKVQGLNNILRFVASEAKKFVRERDGYVDHMTAMTRMCRDCRYRRDWCICNTQVKRRELPKDMLPPVIELLSEGEDEEDSDSSSDDGMYIANISATKGKKQAKIERPTIGLGVVLTSCIQEPGGDDDDDEEEKQDEPPALIHLDDDADEIVAAFDNMDLDFDDHMSVDSPAEYMEIEQNILDVEEVETITMSAAAFDEIMNNDDLALLINFRTVEALHIIPYTILEQFFVTSFYLICGYYGTWFSAFSFMQTCTPFIQEFVEMYICHKNFNPRRLCMFMLIHASIPLSFIAHLAFNIYARFDTFRVLAVHYYMLGFNWVDLIPASGLSQPVVTIDSWRKGLTDITINKISFFLKISVSLGTVYLVISKLGELYEYYTSVEKLTHTSLGEKPSELDIQENDKIAVAKSDYVGPLNGMVNSWNATIHQNVTTPSPGTIPKFTLNNIIDCSIGNIRFKGVFAEGKIFTNYHPFVEVKEGEKMYLKFPHTGVTYMTISYDPKIFTKYLSDVVSFTYICQRRSMRIIYDYIFMPGDVYSINGEDNITGQVISHTCSIKDSDKYGKLDEALYVKTTYKSQLGYSGTPVYLTQRGGSKIEYRIIGLLFSMASDDSTGVFTPIKYVGPQLINTAITFNHDADSIKDLFKKDFNIDLKDTVHHKSITTHLPYVDGYVGSAPNVPIDRKSEFVKTDLYDKALKMFPEIEKYTIPILYPRVENGCYINSTLAAMRQTLSKGKIKHNDPFMKASTFLFDHLDKYMDYSDMKMLSVKQVIAGTKLSQPMNRKTAAGFPYSGKTKDDFVVGSYEDPMFVAAMSQRIQILLERMDQGIPPLNIAVGSLKDEIITNSKNAEGGARVFFSGNMEFLILCKMYLAPIMEQFLSMRDKLFAQVGMNAIGPELHERLMRMCKGDTKSKGWLDSDFSKYDKVLLVLRYAILILKWIIAKSEFFIANPIEHQRAQMVLDALSQYVVMYGPDILLFFDGMPSGVYGTAMVNCLCECLIEILMFYFCFEKTINPFGPFNHDFMDRTIELDFFKVVDLINYGDDNLKYVLAAYRFIYNHERIMAFSDWICMPITPANKTEKFITYKSIDEILFLKRTPTFNPVLQRYVGKLDRSSIGKMLAFTDSIDPSWKEMVLYQAQREIAFHGKQQYEQFLDIFSGEKIHPTSWEDILLDIDKMNIWNMVVDEDKPYYDLLWSNEQHILAEPTSSKITQMGVF